MVETAYTPEQQAKYEAEFAAQVRYGFDENTARIAAENKARGLDLAADPPRYQHRTNGSHSEPLVWTADAPEIGWRMPPAISADEWKRACLTPEVIVELLLYCDVGALIAPGGTGKTTLILWIAVHIVLGLPLLGRMVHRDGAVLIVTAEDSREMLIARLRRICEAMGLTEDEIARVMEGVRISDVSGQGVKLTTVVDDGVVPSPSVDIIIAEAQELAPILVVIDPAVSFGIGESRVNDAEQGLIEAARRIRNALRCCVLYVHHTGKSNAREKALDQYAGRNGSALPDGCRMVMVLQPLTAQEWQQAAGVPLTDGETGMVLALPKLSYAPPQPDILICRKGYSFTTCARGEHDPTTELAGRCLQLLRAIESDALKGINHTQNSLEALKLMNRADLRGAVALLIARGQLEKVESQKRGGPQAYLRVKAAPTDSGAPSSVAA